VPLADVYLEFLAGRCRPNTVLAAAYDLKVFFAVVGKPSDQVLPADVLAFITAQARRRPASIMSRLFPTPPGPVKVTSRTPSRATRSSSAAAS
jgi:integrase/recombinase XerD